MIGQDQLYKKPQPKWWVCTVCHIPFRCYEALTVLAVLMIAGGAGASSLNRPVHVRLATASVRRHDAGMSNEKADPQIIWRGYDTLNMRMDFRVTHLGQEIECRIARRTRDVAPPLKEIFRGENNRRKVIHQAFDKHQDYFLDRAHKAIHAERVEDGVLWLDIDDFPETR